MAPPNNTANVFEPYLRTIFGFVGIADQTFFNAQPMDVTPELRRAAFAEVLSDVRSWVAQDEWGVAAQVLEQPIPAGAKPAVLAD